MKTSFVYASFGAILAAAALTACVVVPVGPDGRAYPMQPLQPMPAPHAAAPVVVAPPAPAVMSARLYPLNSTAQASGLAAGQVTNYLDGKGSFNIQIGGEQFSGEATRASRGASTGVANAVGNRGSGMSCAYTMNNVTQGTGKCTLTSGAEFQLHLGS